MTMNRQLQLFKGENFLSDPFFSDLTTSSDLHKRLEEINFNSGNALIASSLNGGGLSSEPHNLQVTVSNDKLMIQLELPGFEPEEFELKSVNDECLLLSAIHKSGNGEEETQRSYTKEFDLPSGVLSDQIKSSYSATGILKIEAPRQLVVPKGSELEEAMAANSKAYTSDDGNTKVKESSSSAMQKLATTTQSEDGSRKSTMSYSSSSSSSSSMMTTASGGVGGSIPFPSMDMPSLPQMSMNMDDMMRQMKSGMSIMDTPTGFGTGGAALMSSTSPFSSSTGGGRTMSSTMSSSSSSTTTSSSKMQKSSIGGGDMISGFSSPFPSMFPDKVNSQLNIEELSNAGSDATCTTPQSVMSPPPPTAKAPSPPAAKSGGQQQNVHSVKATEDYKIKNKQQQATTGGVLTDRSVLMKSDDGNGFKLVLNMQSYKPENISVKLNGQVLTVTANDGSCASVKSASGEQFVQKHNLPSHLNLDNLTSTFSKDGILVIKAPKKK